jgi:hypothetical protein
MILFGQTRCGRLRKEGWLASESRCMLFQEPHPIGITAALLAVPTKHETGLINQGISMSYRSRNAWGKMPSWELVNCDVGA